MAGQPAGDDLRFARLVGEHQRALRRHCFRLLGSYDESEDLVQETLLRAWQGWASFEGRSSFRTWLYRIATNACLSELASRSRRPATSAWPEGLPGPAGDDLDAALATQEFVERAWLLAIRRLPASQRMVVLVRDLLGWPAKDAAEFLGISVASANSRLQRARETLRELFAGWDAGSVLEPSPRERALLACYATVLDRPDPQALTRLRQLELGSAG